MDLGEILVELQRDLVPVAESKQVNVRIDFTPARVIGNAARLRNGVFQLLDFLLRRCGKGGMIRVCDGHDGRGASHPGSCVIDFIATTAFGDDDAASPRDMGWRLAQRTFHAAVEN